VSGMARNKEARRTPPRAFLRHRGAVLRPKPSVSGTHLAVRNLEMLRNFIGRLEDRYQAPVDVGYAEREVADRMLMEGLKPECPELPLMFLRCRGRWCRC